MSSYFVGTIIPVVPILNPVMHLGCCTKTNNTILLAHKMAPRTTYTLRVRRRTLWPFYLGTGQSLEEVSIRAVANIVKKEIAVG